MRKYLFIAFFSFFVLPLAAEKQYTVVLDAGHGGKLPLEILVIDIAAFFGDLRKINAAFHTILYNSRQIERPLFLYFFRTTPALSSILREAITDTVSAYLLSS